MSLSSPHHRVFALQRFQTSSSFIPLPSSILQVPNHPTTQYATQVSRKSHCNSIKPAFQIKKGDADDGEKTKSEITPHYTCTNYTYKLSISYSNTSSYSTSIISCTQTHSTIHSPHKYPLKVNTRTPLFANKIQIEKPRTRVVCGLQHRSTLQCISNAYTRTGNIDTATYLDRRCRKGILYREDVQDALPRCIDQLTIYCTPTYIYKKMHILLDGVR